MANSLLACEQFLVTFVIIRSCFVRKCTSKLLSTAEDTEIKLFGVVCSCTQLRSKVERWQFLTVEL